MADLPHYTYSDIRRYLQQQMTAEEMHAFETVMMDDPFLADAMDGLQQSDAGLAWEHLSEIERKLTQKEEAKIIPISKNKRPGWWRVAALVIVLAGSGLLVFKVLNSPQERTVVAENTVLHIPEKKDSIGPVEKPVLNNTPAAKNITDLQSYNLKQPNSSLKDKPSLNGTELTTAEPISSSRLKRHEENVANTSPAANINQDTSVQFNFRSSANTAAAPTSPATRQSVYAKSAPEQFSLEKEISQREFRGKVLDQNRQPLPFASVEANKIIKTTADNKGNFSLKAADSVLDVQVSSIGFASAIKQLKSDAVSNEIVLREANTVLNDVVVVGYGKGRKGKITGNVQAENKRLVQDTLTSGAEPEGGWQSFQEYVYGQLKKERDTGNTYISGDVLVEFNVDERGVPRNINVARPPQKEVAEKAVQLIQKGPRWKLTSKSRKARVIIQF